LAVPVRFVRCADYLFISFPFFSFQRSQNCAKKKETVQKPCNSVAVL